MRNLHVLALFLGMALAPVISSADAVEYPPYPKINYGTGSAAQLIHRGEYLVKAGDCMACHTDTNPKKPGIPFTGGLGIATPFGTFYTPNITPDKDTGIGKWTDADFIRAMHSGIGADGSYYFPVFPYTSFTKVSDDDLKAIKAYLFTLTPVHKQNLKTTAPWPFSWRFSQLGWRILFFRENYYHYDTKQNPQWNRGAYLVQGLGHCGECHTPRNMLGAMEDKHYLTGAFVGGYYAPDITAFGLKDASLDDIVNVFTKGKMLKGAGMVQGPMEEVNRDSLQYMDRADLYAMAAYLKTVKSEEPKTSSGPVGAGAGKKIYSAHCAVCHGTGAAGAPKLGDLTDWAPRIKQGMTILDQHAINGFNSMPPKGTCMSCSDDEIKAAVQYLADQSKPGAAGAGAPATIAAPPPLTLADGKHIYDKSCSVCHAQGVGGAPKTGDKAAWAPLIKQNMDVLFTHTIQGYKGMPARGACTGCTNAELQAAVKYMAQQSSNNNYSLW